MRIAGPQQHSQAFRPVHGDSILNPQSRTVDIDTRLDNKTGERIILWKDVQMVFKDALYIRNGGTAVSFLMDDNFEL